MAVGFGLCGFCLQRQIESSMPDERFGFRSYDSAGFATSFGFETSVYNLSFA